VRRKALSPPGRAIWLSGGGEAVYQRAKTTAAG
jgi:hypothetical protein